ncbi:hypothetical protein SAMN05444266_109323 [Chitinophaga jiangningensis]|uniref:Uncharacterized protein n=1 Tax=Chitinophaga jiangningensis TaxID=1419482 RepID=A0A1M7KH27_9BACT|nr:hypothetical protein [Chitinophaga jiangningensis]SHM64665.1 hypothetical protein SAMN05444266_109323 [Chitinophaga jiangningensis]
MQHSLFRKPVTDSLVYRFFETYLLLFMVISLVCALQGFGVGEAWRALIAITGKWLYGSGYTIGALVNGSGDTKFMYATVFTTLLIALMISGIRVVRARKRGWNSTATYWITVIIRYSLALTLLNYGVSKITNQQFTDISLYQLDKPLGYSSPMGLAWNFFGYSRGYNIFMGLAEVIPALLLLFRRTALLGALLTLTVMVNVFALNIFYNIPVKLLSLHLILYALFLASPELGRLIQFFISGEAAAPRKDLKPAYATRKGRVFHLTIKSIITGVILVTMAMDARHMAHRMEQMQQKQPLYGIYRISQPGTGGLRSYQYINWEKLYLDKGHRAMVTLTGQDPIWLNYRTDTAKRVIFLTGGPNIVEFSYQLSGERNYLLTSIKGQDTVLLHAEAVDLSGFLLPRHIFSWQNEYPINK